MTEAREWEALCNERTAERDEARRERDALREALIEAVAVESEPLDPEWCDRVRGLLKGAP